MTGCYLCNSPCKSKFCSGGHRKLYNRWHFEAIQRRKEEKLIQASLVENQIRVADGLDPITISDKEKKDKD